MTVMELGQQNQDTILLLHGGGLSWWNYRAVAEMLVEQYHVVLPVLDGHAGCDAPFTSEWFTAHGIGENLGHVLLSENKAVMDILRDAFAAWFDNGHTNKADPNTCLLKIRLTDGVLFADGIRHDIEFGGNP